MAKRPRTLTAAFVRPINRPGVYGDGRGGRGLSLRVHRTATGRITKTWRQRLRIGGRLTSVALLLGLLAASGCRESPFEPDIPENNVVVDDGRDYGDDPYVVNSAAIDGDRLTISVSYAGGCRNHIFTLVISQSFLESDPVQLPAVLAHEANGDPCEAYPTESHVFDLTLVRTRYRQSYGPGPGKVILRIAGVPGDDLLYQFDR